MGIKVLAIAPYQGLKKVIEQLGEEDKQLDIHVVYGNLKEGLEAAKSAEEQGYEMILSRGGTAKLIKEEVSIPVIDIQVSGYDVLRVLTLAKDYSGRVAILGFPSISHGAATICSLLEIDIATYTIYDESEVEPKLNEIKKQGFDVIIGDVITVETARKLGLQEILITSGSESVREAFQDLKETYRFFRHITQKHQLLKQALHQSKQGIFILNENGHAVYFNKAAEGLKADGFLSQPPVQSFFQGMELEKNHLAVLQMDGMIYPISGVRLHLDQQNYTILYIDSPSRDFEKQIGITIKEPVPSPDPYPFSRITGSSEAIGQVVQKAKVYSRSDMPIWLSGEKGTGKEIFAHLIHQGGSRNDQPMIQLDAAQIEAGKWEEILWHSEKDRRIPPLSHFGTFYIQNVERLPIPIGNQLGSLFDSEIRNLPRLIVSSRGGIDGLWESNRFSQRLSEVLAQGNIHIPPLRERTEDIEDLSRLFIAHFNSLYGKEIVGIQRDLFDELETLPWPGNVAELRQAIGQFVLQSTGPYIQAEEVSSVLKDLKGNRQVHSREDINLTGTLEEIEKQIIEKILHEENMNQSKTAKRLGINRTTLWRKLK